MHSSPLAGAFSADLLIPGGAPDERSAIAGLLVAQSALAVLMQAIFGIGSSALLLLSAVSLFAGYSLDMVLRALYGSAAAQPAKQNGTSSPKKGKAGALERRYAKKQEGDLKVDWYPMPLLSYTLGQIVPLAFGVELLLGNLDVFVPLVRSFCVEKLASS